MMPSTVFRAMIALASILVLASFAEGIVAPQIDPPGHYYCWATGDPHMKTFDDARFPLYDTCKYLMASTLHQDDDCSFQVELKTEERPDSKQPNRFYTRLIDFKYRHNVIRIHPEGRVSINRVPEEISTFLSDQQVINITKDGRWVNITNTCDLNVAFDGDKKAVITVGAYYKLELNVKGLCGNLNSNKDDDLEVNGKDVRTYRPIKRGYNALAQHYLVYDDSDVPNFSESCTIPELPA